MEVILKKELWCSLPIEVLHIILSYSNEVKFRNGKYIDRFNQERDTRFKLLKTVRPPLYGLYTVVLCLFNNIDKIYIYLYYYNSDRTLGQGHKTNDLLCKVQTPLKVETSKYKKDLSGKWWKFVDYSM